MESSPHEEALATVAISAIYSHAQFCDEMRDLLARLRAQPTLQAARQELFVWVNHRQRIALSSTNLRWNRTVTIIRDCARALRSLLSERGETLSGTSLACALYDLARGVARADLTPAFFGEITHLLRGIASTPDDETFPMENHFDRLVGREAALARSADLDALWGKVDQRLRRYPSGLDPEVIERRTVRRRRLQEALQASDQDWQSWEWQTRHLITDLPGLTALTALTDEEREAVGIVTEHRLPFGITPYYLSLMDDDPAAGHDRAVRAQVLPTLTLARAMVARGADRRETLDFMRENDTSPVDLVTRRYPSICILKPYNTCPQICAYCQRNWEIDQVMDPCALAGPDQIDRALDWIATHPSIQEVLITGGDPLAMTDGQIAHLLDRVAAIPHVGVVRFGTRVPATLPMRLTPELLQILGSHRDPGRREICLVTHMQHSYEITPDLVAAIDRVRRQGIGVYNQLVYTFHVSRRFEAARLRLLLRRVGIDPYYTFVPKGKEETSAYRVPVARLLQERKEEARLLPGLCRTDEPVYNLPALGKNHIRATQDRDLIGIHPDGSRVYEFHPWEKNILDRGSYVGRDVPILEYLERLAAIGEDPADYAGIWYYY